MGLAPSSFLKQNNILFFGFLMILVLRCIPDRSKRSPNPSFARTSPHSSSSKVFLSLRKLNLDGYFSFKNIHHAAKDFGNTYHFLPSAVLHPKSVSDISSTIKHIFDMGSTTNLKVAARGHGHSLQGQAQAHQGVVINMESLQRPKMHVHTGQLPYVDVSGGELWINILYETVKYGLAPKSWTDYLHLTVGGTLSNAGISGQAFHHGPQIHNVYQMEVVTGISKQPIYIRSYKIELHYTQA